MTEGDAQSHGRRAGVFFRRMLRMLPAGVSLLLAAALAMGAMQWIGNPASRASLYGVAQNPGSRFGMYLKNRISEVLDGVLSLDRVYWIGREELSAPVPDAEAFGEAEPGTLDFLTDASEHLMEGESLFFRPDAAFAPGTAVQYYQDETILAITWKQVMDDGIYTFSEIKIAHPSQFRRFLAGGEFGSDKLYVTTEMARSVHAVVASSGDFYGYRRAGVLVYDGKVRRINNGLVDTCYVDENGDLLFSGRFDEMEQDEAQAFVDENQILFSLAFGPVLIRGGEVCTPDSYAVGEINDHYPRSALCQLGKLHYLLAVVNSEGEHQSVPTIHRFAENLKNMGVKTAYALDGGQTAVIAMNGELTNAVLFGYQRRISDIIYFATAIPGKEE